MKIIMHRRADWQIRLNQYIADCQHRTFRYGRHDCCLFSAGAVRAMCGVDTMAEFRKKYSSEKSARLALKKYGKGTLYHTLQSKFGNPVAAAHASRGDIAYMPAMTTAGIKIGVRLGIVIGAEAIFLTDGGYHRVAITLVKHAFKVPF